MNKVINSIRDKKNKMVEFCQRQKNKMVKFCLRIGCYINTNPLNVGVIILSIFLLMGFYNIQYIQIIIWPFLVLIAIKTFKSSICELFDRLSGFKISTPAGQIKGSLQAKTPSQAANEAINTALDSDANKSSKVEPENYSLNSIIRTYNESGDMTKIEGLVAKDFIIKMEIIYNFIIDAQIILLMILQDYKNINQAASCQFVEQFYDKNKRSINFPYGPYFMGYLAEHELVKIDKGQIEITRFGITFLSYIRARGYLPLRPGLNYYIQ